MEKVGGIGMFLCERNSYNILHKTGVRVSIGFFTFLKFSFLSIFSILTLMNKPYFVDGPLSGLPQKYRPTSEVGDSGSFLEIFSSHNYCPERFFRGILRFFRVFRDFF